ncbi:MAG: S1 family peptidase [Vulcanimicrobiaceae bacterium]
MISVTNSGLTVSIEQSVKPPAASFVLDGSVTPVPVVTRQQIVSGIVIAADATHSYVVSIVPVAALASIRVGNPYAVAPRRIWRLENATVLVRDEQTNLTLLSVAKLRVTPATFSRRTRELEEVRVYFVNALSMDNARSLDSDLSSDVSSDEGVIRVLHSTPPGFDFSDDRGGRWNGSIVADKATHLALGIANSQGRTAGNMQFGASAASIVALAAKAHLSVAFASEDQTTAMTISNVPTPATMLVRRVLPSVARIAVDGAVGSGVAVLRSGNATYVVTTANVLKKKTSATIYFANATKGTRAAVVRTDPKTDLALLRVDGVGAIPIMLARTALPGLDIGVLVFDPGDFQFSGLPHLSQGTVSSVDDARGTLDYDAPVDDGNLGAPIVELTSGALIGLAGGQPNPGEYDGVSIVPIRRLLSGLPGM